LEEISTAVVLETAVLARSRLQLCCGIRFTGEFQRLLPLSALVLRVQFVLRLVCDFGILRAERYFVILDYFFVILDVSEVISDLGRRPHDSSLLMLNFTAKFETEDRERGRRIRQGYEKNRPLYRDEYCITIHQGAPLSYDICTSLLARYCIMIHQAALSRADVCDS